MTFCDRLNTRETSRPSLVAIYLSWMSPFFLDMYNGSSTSCSVHSVPDYGNRYAIRLR